MSTEDSATNRHYMRQKALDALDSAITLVDAIRTLTQRPPLDLEVLSKRLGHVVFELESISMELEKP